MDILRAQGQVQGIGARGEGAVQGRVVRNLDVGHQQTAEGFRVLQGKLHRKILIHIVCQLVFLKFFTVAFPNREMHEVVDIFIERHHQAGEIDLSRHLEIEEVAVQLDAALHEVVVDNRSIEILHLVTASAIDVNGAVDLHRAFQIVEVEAFHVHIDF